MMTTRWRLELIEDSHVASKISQIDTNLPFFSFLEMEIAFQFAPSVHIADLQSALFWSWPRLFQMNFLIQHASILNIYLSLMNHEYDHQ